MRKLSILTLLIGFLVITPFLNAQWSNNLNENTIVTLFTTQPTLVSNGQNGLIVFSQSRDVNPILRAQRISVQGRLLWPGQQGVRVSDAMDAQWIRQFAQEGRFALPDGEGGAYFAYQVGRIIGEWPEVGDIYAISCFVQRLNSSGNRLFGSDGLRLVPILPDTFLFEQEIMNMIPDGVGGVYVLVETGALDSTQYNGVYLNRIDKNGSALWETVKLTNDTNTDYLPFLDNNLNLNLYYLPAESTPPIKDQFIKIDATNGEIISQMDIEIGVGPSGFNAFYDFDQSDSGSAIFAFYDFRADTLRIQKLGGNGNKLWGEMPVIVSKEPTFSYRPFEIMSDTKDGAYLWYQTIDSVLHVVHLNGQGKIRWEEQFGPERLGDFPTSISSTFKRPMTVGSDSSVFILTDGFQQVTKISRLGEVLWETRISNRAAIAAGIDDYAALADEDGGCIVVWEEVGNFVGLQAQRVDRHGNLGGATPVEEGPTIPNDFLFEAPQPNPFNDTVQIVFSLPQAAEVSLKIYNILGREVITLKKEKLFGGRHQVLWNGTDKDNRKLPSGIYFMALSTGQILLTQKVLLLK